MKTFSFPGDFLFGTATAAVQIEGGDRNNSWYRWSHVPGRIQDGTTCSIASDHWNRVDEDIAIMKKMNQKSYRMGIEWSRIEPHMDVFDKETLTHYRNEIKKLIAAGIRPLVTLHHFSNPIWIEDSIPWTNPMVIDRFTLYTEYLVRNLGDLVSDWVTINEPNVYLIFGYLYGEWPPGKRSLPLYLKGAKNMIGAHISAYQAIHRIRREMGHHDTRVGAAHHLRVFDPLTERKADRLLINLYDRLFHDLFVTGMATGRVLFPAGCGYPFGKGDFQDYFGVNYYTRDMVTFDLKDPAGMTSVQRGCEINDLGWEIYPEGLYRICSRYYMKFNKPIFITENGTCDASDRFRTRYIYDHLYQVHRCIADGIDVQRYYHWSLMDNFEWAEGLSARFGLAAVDYETHRRLLRTSGKFYGEIAHEMRVSEGMIKRYLKEPLKTDTQE